MTSTNTGGGPNINNFQMSFSLFATSSASTPASASTQGGTISPLVSMAMASSPSPTSNMGTMIGISNEVVAETEEKHYEAGTAKHYKTIRIIDDLFHDYLVGPKSELEQECKAAKEIALALSQTIEAGVSEDSDSDGDDSLADYSAPKKHETTAEEILRFLGKNSVGMGLELDVQETKLTDGSYAIKVPHAKCTMDQEFAELFDNGPAKDHFQTMAKLCTEFLHGMCDLQAAGYVHGNLKAGNLKIYQDEQFINAEKSLKISGLKKVQLCKDNQESTYTGNMRTVNPEGILSKNGEVYSVALLLTGMLESEFLYYANTKRNTDMLVQPETTAANSIYPLPDNCHGFEKFLCLDKDCPQFAADSTAGKITRVAQTVASFIPFVSSWVAYDPTCAAAKQIRTKVHKYIDAVCDELTNKYQDAFNIKALNALLKKMTDEKPSQRGTMQDAMTEFSKAVKPSSGGSSKKTDEHKL